jgi:hypothetical protein
MARSTQVTGVDQYRGVGLAGSKVLLCRPAVATEAAHDICQPGPQMNQAHLESLAIPDWARMLDTNTLLSGVSVEVGDYELRFYATKPG